MSDAGTGTGDGELALLVGEVRTALLRHSGAVSEPVAQEILDLVPAAAVRSATRPSARAVSPDIVEGVHCRLPSGTGRRVEGVGTVVSRAVIAGGRIAQASSRALVVPAAGTRRRGWAAYLARRGVIERIGRGSADDLSAGFLGPRRPGTIDLDAVAGRLLDRVQAAPALDGAVPLRAARTRFRFVIDLADRAETVTPAPPRFSLDDDNVRTLILDAPRGGPEALVTLCEDIACHDWLLTVVQGLVDTLDEAPGRVDRMARMARVSPAIEQLLHLWMPCAHLEPDLRWVWSALEGRPGFSRQWASIVDRIRNEQMGSILRAVTGDGWRNGSGAAAD
ncbi:MULTISPECIES: SCO2521 family protein [Frankia]|uniref:Uncharacterized protein n=1 Tax=Frankia alni (strain DSM 45986 / CECT 9034 / ACN14a) TaxID=326424 RepID=Q0RTQ5_FRAAA|nr:MULTISPECIES: SCO2521 family protein [Frankia]CAJ59043.1 hypothetical protein FRAAL0367 [Frankia alni ACN14a]